MQSKRLILLAPLVLLLTWLGACGQEDSTSGGDIEAPVIDNAGVHGMMFAAVNADPSIRNSRIYYYEFAAGVVKELLPSESGNPALFAADGKVFLFNRQPDLQNFRVLDPKNTAAPVGEARSLPSLTAGDPWDVAVVDEGKSLALASALGESLDILNYQTGDVAEVPSADVISGSLRPHGLLKQGNRVYVLHSGVDASGDSDGTQAVYTTLISGGTLTFFDEESGTAKVDGLKVTGSNPTGFVNRDGAGGASILGLCAQEWKGCVSGADRLEGGKTKALNTFSAAEFPYHYMNQVVDGPASNYVYAHVQKSDGSHEIVKIDLQTKAVSSVHSFTSDRLFGMAFDVGSRTLFVGGTDGIKGVVYMYRDDKQVNTFTVDGVLYSAAFVPK